MPKTKKKEFDAIASKEAVQVKISEEIRGMSPDEEIRYFREKVASGPFAGWVKGVPVSSISAPRLRVPVARRLLRPSRPSASRSRTRVRHTA